MQWFIHSFSQLSNQILHDIIRLRIDVFVVEQTCYYPDLDGLDCLPETLHVYAIEDDAIIGYLRAMAPGDVYDNESAIGRVVIAPEARGRSLGHELIKQGIAACEAKWPENAIKMGAQEHLQKYYQHHGFTTCSPMYLEDDIPHVSMIRAANTET
jgi:ElaA protein